MAPPRVVASGGRGRQRDVPPVVAFARRASSFPTPAGPPRSGPPRGGACSARGRGALRRPAAAAAAADPSASTPSLDDASPDDDLSIPADFLCPIGQHVMTDPVLCGCGPQCGKSYDRRSIERWLLEGAPTCPTTSEPLDLHKLYPNRALKSAVEEWLANLGPRGPPADAMPPPSFADTPEAEALRRTCVQGLRVRRQKTGADKNRSEVPVADLRRAAVAAVAARVAVAAEEEASRRAAAAAAAESSSGSGSGSGGRGCEPEPLEPAYGGALHVRSPRAPRRRSRGLADACTDRVRRGYLLRGGAGNWGGGIGGGVRERGGFRHRDARLRRRGRR